MNLIVLAHRLSTVKSADKVVHLDIGAIRAFGSFGDAINEIPDFDKQATFMGLLPSRLFANSDIIFKAFTSLWKLKLLERQEVSAFQLFKTNCKICECLDSAIQDISVGSIY